MDYIKSGLGIPGWQKTKLERAVGRGMGYNSILNGFLSLRIHTPPEKS